MRKEIDRILGNSLRCILPSYWWKRLLSKMADKIESAEESAASASRIAMLAGREASDKQPQLVSGSNIKTINNQSILGSGNIIVGTDTERMEKYKTKEELDAVGSTDGGEIAAVVDAVLVEKSFAECYQPTSAEINANKYNTKFTKVDGLVFNPDFNPNLISSHYGELSVVLYSDGKSKGGHKEYPSYLEIECDYNRQIICWEYDDTSGIGHTLYNSSGFDASKIDRVKKILREGDFRFSYFEVTYRNDVNATSYTYYYSYNANFPSDATAMIDNVVKMLFADTQNADVYVRSSKWVKLLKEGDVVGGGPEILELTFGETEEDRANNVKIYNKIVEAFNSDALNIPMISVAGMLVSNVELSGIEGDIKAHMNLVSDYVVFKYLTTLNLAKTGEVTFEEELEYSDYYYITNSSGMVKFYKCVAAGLLPNVLYPDPRQGLVIADTFNSEGDNIVLYFNLSKGRTKVVVSSETGEILSEEVVSSGADITIDSEISDTSENAVQNKVVKSALDGIAPLYFLNDANAVKPFIDALLSKDSETNKHPRTVFATSIQGSLCYFYADAYRLYEENGKGIFSVEYNLNDKRYRRDYDFNTGEFIKEEEIAISNIDTSNLATKEDINTKQDKIDDLEVLRSGAALGATALQSVPSIYATKTDVDNAIASAITNTLNTEV